MRVVYKDVVLAESDRTELVENNHYFPREAVNMDLFVKSDTEYTCPWKGEATYYSIKIGDEVIRDAAWSYEDPKEKARNITGYIAFEKQFVE